MRGCGLKANREGFNKCIKLFSESYRVEPVFVTHLRAWWKSAKDGNLTQMTTSKAARNYYPNRGSTAARVLNLRPKSRSKIFE